MARYIDVDKLKKDLKELPEQERIEYMGIYAFINSQPAADVQEVKHGKWEHNYPICSNCEHVIAVDLSHAKEFYHYCPNCGAKMGSEE